MIKEVENISVYVHSFGDVEGLSKFDTKSTKGITVKYNFINESFWISTHNANKIKRQMIHWEK